ncbi:anti-sigma factor antagonist [Pullulanibacillus camelliae]|uniref:Anti-sigma factor antagonist n=1 Tax=Pullulanibacillus camelliae TaxID=1707096 RepID=A0A8J2VLC4_9BACL|nr:STAS domain-containing protein [Pullulanibacillus camelliae]GGE29765.1 anti-sigma factor antagonist [Pullulanibacillus camelliae]
MSLMINKKVDDQTMTLYLKGIVDITTTAQLNPYLEEITDQLKALIFDFTEVEFMDSTGIGSILNAIYLAQEMEFKVIFKGVNELVDQVFDTVGIYQILETVQREEI